MHDAVIEFPRNLSSYPVIAGQPLLDVLRVAHRGRPVQRRRDADLPAGRHPHVRRRRFTEASHRVQARTTPQLRAAGLPPRPSVAAELLHFLGEVEVVFGLWAMPLLVAILVIARLDDGRGTTSTTRSTTPSRCSWS